MKVRICHNCGKYNQPDALSCIMCGTDIRSNVVQEVPDASGERYDASRASLTRNAAPQPTAAAVFQPAAQQPPMITTNNGVITDIQIPFGRMIVIILQFYLASIPAAILVGIIVAIVFGCLSAIGAISLGSIFNR
jgi:hypothetical protein